MSTLWRPRQPPGQAASANHPLDPLTAAEIAQRCHDHPRPLRLGRRPAGRDHRLCRAGQRPRARLRREPAFERIARYNVFQRGKLGVWQGRVDLRAGTDRRRAFRRECPRHGGGRGSPARSKRTVKADPRFQEALRRRGLLDELEFMCVDPWTVGDFGHDDRERAAASSTASSGCGRSRSTTTTPTPSRGCTR